MQLKYRSFVGDIDITNYQTPQIEAISQQLQEPEKIKHILIGSRKAFTKKEGRSAHPLIGVGLKQAQTRGVSLLPP